ncbi:mevalonate kinase [Candidatus Micrarchaeota archaeon]|nr:mevalonate kinase [Candidatus Micrarchaeota archaeon]
MHGEGTGKVILYGEHFVVQGVPAIAVGISNKCVVDIEPSEKMESVTDLMIVPETSRKATMAVFRAMGEKGNFRVYIKGDLPTFGGLGSSAAYSVALVKAIAKMQGKNLAPEQINKYAYEGEKVFHGDPSGIDNTMATYGGAILFRRGDSDFERLKIGKPLHLVVGITGVPSPTAKMVSNVAKFKEFNPNEFSLLSEKMENIIGRGKSALEKGEMDLLGNLMNENQKLLEKIGVSTELNREINETALKEGALGAKLTGGGGGGCCISLAENKSHSEKISSAVKKEGFDSFSTVVLP